MPAQELLAGRYRPLRLIGTGGMARVFLAEDERLGRRVAVKRLHAHSPEEMARRFQREARIGASLNHANLVSVFDVDTDGESVLIVMEYVEGSTLAEELKAGPMKESRAASIVEEIAGALDHAHAQGVVHRDVKPANILLRRDGTAKLADLGIAIAAEHTQITASGTVLGTAAYMAPEQLEGGEVGQAADVYSLAAVAFEALSGQKARAGDTPMAVAH
ncbi:MAG: serine/threonine-protein kinase, partial [Thermoleophilaceae bacterium]